MTQVAKSVSIFIVVSIIGYCLSKTMKDDDFKSNS